MKQNAKEIAVLFFSILIVIVIDTGLIMITWNYFLYDIFGADKITMAETFVCLMLLRFVVFRGYSK